MSVSDAASFAVAFAAFAALGISSWQSIIMVRQQRAAIRPFLRPGPSTLDDTPTFQSPLGYMVRPINVGLGPAFNISACLYPPQPHAGETVDAKGVACYQHTAIDVFRGTLNEKGNTGLATLALNEGILVPGEHCLDRRGQVTLFAPPSPFTEGKFVVPTRLPVLARLSLTYQDVEGRKHAAIFDYLERHGWKQVKYLHNIPNTLDELNARYTHNTLHAGPRAMKAQAKLFRLD